MTKTWDRSAMRFASAKYRADEGMLEVVFEDGDRFLVGGESLLPWANESGPRRAGTRSAGRAGTAMPIPWTKLRIGETGDVLEIPAGAETIEIPWDRIRAIADPQFRAHLADKSHDRARRLGERVRAMRLDSGLTQAVLAKKVGVSPQVIAGLEAGEIEPETDLLQHIAGIMGRGLRDFVQD